MATVVSPTSATPSHDLTLTDGVNTVGFVLVNSQGEKSERSIQEYPQNRTAIKLTSGDGQYSDYNLPYMSIEQSNWSSGRGNKRFEDDRSRFWDSIRAYTEKDSRVLLGGIETYSTGLRTWQGFSPTTGGAYLPMYSGTRFRATSFTAAASFTLSQIELWADQTGTNNYLQVHIYSNNAGEPGTSLASAYWRSPSAYPGAYHTSTLVDISVALTASTVYWLVVDGDSGTLGETPTATSCAYLYENTATSPGTAKSSANGSTWAAGTAFVFRLLDNATAYTPTLFEYKKSLYMVKRFYSGADSTLWRNGDRGAADSNSGDKTLLNDATKSWTVNEWAGAIVMIVGGPGVQEEQPHRTIVSNTATALLVDQTWNTAHTTATEYVILKSNKWTQVAPTPDMNGDCTDVAVTGEVVYFALGDSTNVLRYQEYNNSGTWTTRTASDTLKATYLQYIRHSVRGGMLFAARISDTYTPGDFTANSIQVQDIPDYWSPTDGTGNAGMFRLHELTTGEKNWTGVINTVTQTLNADGDLQLAIPAGFTTGVIAAQDIIPMDVSDSNQVAILVQSSVATTAGQLQLVIDDIITLGHNYGATAIWQLVGSTYTDLESARDGDLATNEAITLASTDYLIVGCNEQFNIATLDFEAFNSNAATLTAQYYNGATWATLTIVDNTTSGGKTFAQDGTVTFTIPYDWSVFAVNNTNAYYIRLKVSASTSAVQLNEITVRRANNNVFSIPALTATEWTWVTCAYNPTGGTNPRPTSIQSIGLQLSADLGAMTVKVRGGVWAGKNTKHYPISSIGKVTALSAYSADATGRMNPWIFTDNGIYEMQIDNDFQIVPLPIGEISQFSDHRNGRAWALNDVYIYFNLKNKIERYYNRTLDDIGPDRDIAYIGNVASIVSYPGHIIAAFNGDGTGNSNVMSLRNSGWHSLYRSPYNGTTNVEVTVYQPKITSMYHQPIPGSNMGRLWIVENSDVLWIPTSPDPENESEYRFAPRAVLVSSRIYGGMQEMIKIFKSLKMVSNVSSSYAKIRADYRTTETEAGWVELPTLFTPYPSQEVDLKSTSPGGVSAKWIQLRFRIYGALDPRVDAWVLECYGVVPTKWAYSWTSIIREDYLSIDLQQTQELALGYSSRSETAYTQLKTWANAGTPLTMNSRASVYDSKTVIINPPASQPLRIDSLNQHEEILVNITALDL